MAQCSMGRAARLSTVRAGEEGAAACALMWCVAQHGGGGASSSRRWRLAMTHEAVLWTRMPHWVVCRTLSDNAKCKSQMHNSHSGG